MPRYRVKTLLLISAVVALWLSTFSEYTSKEDVRQLIVIAVTLMSATAALSATGSKRAFWGGFTASMAIFQTRSAFYSAPRMLWLQELAAKLSGFRDPLTSNIQVTLTVVAWLLISAAIGWLCANVYREAKREE
jgi:thiosulfate reductase cytochrome b subunit